MCEPRPQTYSYETLKVLQRVWLVAGDPSGKYLAPAMPVASGNLEAHSGCRSFGKETPRYGPDVKAQLLRMGAATSDRLPGPYKGTPHLSAWPGQDTAALRTARFEVTVCLLHDGPDAAESAAADFAHGGFDVVEIGAGLRASPEYTLVFERSSTRYPDSSRVSGSASTTRPRRPWMRSCAASRGEPEVHHTATLDNGPSGGMSGWTP